MVVLVLDIVEQECPQAYHISGCSGQAFHGSGIFGSDSFPAADVMFVLSTTMVSERFHNEGQDELAKEEEQEEYKYSATTMNMFMRIVRMMKTTTMMMMLMMMDHNFNNEITLAAARK